MKDKSLSNSNYSDGDIIDMPGFRVDNICVIFVKSRQDVERHGSLLMFVIYCQ